jgi:rhodanese-related sulfurtransferase
MGYASVWAFVGGIPEWRKFNYPMNIDKTWQEISIRKIVPNELGRIMKEKDFYILDVRPLDFDLNRSFIKGSFLCPLVYLSERYTEIPKDREIVVTDWAMKQSPVAAKFLQVKGYPVYGVLKGGIERWKAEKLPVEQWETTNDLPSLTRP